MSNILLKNLVDGPITPQMIVYVTQKATSVIPCDSMLSSLSSSSSSSTLSNSNSNHINNKSNNKNNNHNHNKNNNNKNLNQSSSASSLSINTDNNHVHHIHHDEDLQLLPPLQNFIQRLVTRSSVSTATFLTTIIYLDRLKKKLPKLARGMHCTRHRVFLAILIVASKYLNDSSPRNKYWARFSSVYSVNKVNLMERQLLTLLDYDLRVTEAELLLHLSPFLKSPSSLSTSYNNHSTGNTLIDTLKLPYPINSNLNNNNNGNLDNLDNRTINNSNEYIQRTCSYPQMSIPKPLPLSMYDNDNNMNTINNNNNNVFSSPSSYQPLIVDNNNNYNYNDDNDDAMNTDEDDEFSSNTNNVNTVINDNSFSNFSQNIDQHQTKDQFGRRLSSTSTCSSSSTSSITTPTSVPTAFQNNSNNLLLQQQLNHLQLLQLQLNLFNKQPDIPSIPSIITPTSTNYLQSQHQLNQNPHNHHHHHHHHHQQQQSSFQPPPLKSLLSDAGADNYFGSSDFNNNNHNQIHHSHYNYNLPILNVNNHNNNNFHQHYNHIILPNPVNTTTTTNVSYME